MSTNSTVRNTLRNLAQPCATRFAAPVVVALLLLAGCAATTPAPVSERVIPGKTPPRVVEVKPPEPVIPTKPDAGVVVKPLATADAPSYTVKAGDTLFSIAKANGVTLRDLSAWNSIEDPANISVGQVLRLTPPDGVAVTAVKPPGAVETRPIGATGATGATSATGTPDTTRTGEIAPPARDANLKTQPLGQRVPYSEQAYAQMAKGATVAAGTEPKVAAKADVKAETKPEVKPDTKAETKPETKPEPPRASGDIDWSWPVEGKVIGNFNESSSKGITIAGKRGQAIHATAAGRVIFSGTGIRGLGKLVVIRHNSTYLSVYAHNDKLLVKEGQNVTQGQRIAEMGNSDADQVKLHFEIRRQGKPVDPIKLLPPA